VVGFIYIFSHGVVMKRNNSSLTKDEILAFWNLFAYCTNNLSKGLQEDCNKFKQLLLCSIDRWQKLSEVKTRLK
jgi:hypothetical protein